MESADRGPLITSLIDLCYRVLGELNRLNALSESPQRKFFTSLEDLGASPPSTHLIDYANGVFVVIKFVREHIDHTLKICELEIGLNSWAY